MYSQANAALIAADGWHMDKGGPLQMHWSVVDRMMDAARAGGEQAGVQKAEHAAADHIAMLEARFLALLARCPDDVKVGSIRRDAEKILAEHRSMKVQLDAAEMELGHAIDRARRAEAELARWKGPLDLQAPDDAHAGQVDAMHQVIDGLRKLVAAP